MFTLLCAMCTEASAFELAAAIVISMPELFLMGAFYAGSFPLWTLLLLNGISGTKFIETAAQFSLLCACVSVWGSIVHNVVIGWLVATRWVHFNEKKSLHNKRDNLNNERVACGSRNCSTLTSTFSAAKCENFLLSCGFCAKRCFPSN